RAFGTALLGQQSGQSMLSEGLFGLVERRAGNTKQSGRFGLLHARGIDLAQHLVLHLGQIPSIEEAFGLEPRCPYAFRVPVQASLLLEELRFGVALGQSCIRGIYDVNTYT